MNMSISEAEEALNTYSELLAAATKYAESRAPYAASWGVERAWSIDRIYWEDSVFKVEWVRYIGCGDYDHDSTCFTLQEMLEAQE